MRGWMMAIVGAGLLTGCPKVKALEAAVAEHEATITGLRGEIEGLNGTVAERDATIAAQEAKIAELEGQIADLRVKIAELEGDLAASEGALAAEREKSARILSDKGAMRAEIEEMKAAMEELEARKRAAEERVAEFKDLLSRFKSLIDAGTLEVKIVDGRMVVAMKTDILFASGSAKLSDDGKTALTEVAGVLKELPDKHFQIEGHTDNVPIGNEKYPSNWYLASGRAIGVVDTLVGAGMAATQLSAASYGEQRPVADNGTPEGKAANRRIEIVIVPDLSDLPGFDELTAISGGAAP